MVEVLGNTNNLIIDRCTAEKCCRSLFWGVVFFSVFYILLINPLREIWAVLITYVRLWQPQEQRYPDHQ